MANFADCAVSIVGGDFDNQSDSARTVALKGDFLVDGTGQLTGTALDGTLNVVLGHVLGFGRGDGPAQPGVGIRVATALTGGHGDFADEAGEDLAPFGVEGAFFVLDCGPFRVAG